jgi:hypothetical protein
MADQIRSDLPEFLRSDKNMKFRKRCIYMHLISWLKINRNQVSYKCFGLIREDNMKSEFL